MTGPHGNNTYLLVDGGDAVLVDAGVGERRHLGDIETALSDTDARLGSVAVTHGHRDHAAGAPALAEAHPAASFLKQPWPSEDALYPVPWRAIGEGDTIDVGSERLVALCTPGHSPDHLAFWHEATGTVFTGDLVVAGGSVMIHASRGGDLAQYLASLERLIVLGPRVLLPAHGTRIDDPQAVLTAYLAHRRMREHQVLDALRTGHATVEAIADCIYDDLDPALTPAARENVRAHLEKLRTEGRAAEHGHRWQLS